MAKLGAIVLAAGLSRRMGAQNKLLLPVGGVPMVRAVVRTYLEAIDGETVVVLGHEADAVRNALYNLPVRFVQNPDYKRGQPTSVAAGLRAAAEADGLFIGLGDQPQITAANLRALAKAQADVDADRIAIPVNGPARGNPILVPSALRPRLLENPDRPGCMRFTRDHPEHVVPVPLTQQGFYADIDTPQAYAALTEVLSCAT